MTKSTYIIVGVIIILLAGVVYFTNFGSQNANGVNPVVGNAKNTNSVTNKATAPSGTNATTNKVAEVKPAGSHFKCDGGKSMDGTFIFVGVPRTELSLIDANGSKRSVTLPQDLTASKPVFKTKDGSTVLINKGNGSVSLEEKGVITFANCKAS